jgi:serine/threonine-protein kinase RsbW
MTMTADPRRLQDAREWARRAAADAGLDEPDCFQVKLAISEAVGNAIRHGSRTNTDCIELEAYRRDGSLVFEVRDTGTFVAPVARAAADAESGRGLELLRLMMDDVQMTSTGAGSLLSFAKRLA